MKENTMKRIIVALLLTTSLSIAAGPQPPSFTFTWSGRGTTALADTNTWLANVPMVLTNCPYLNGTNVVDLTGCGIIIRVGDSTTNVAYYGAVQSPATSGLFNCAFMIPNATATVATATSTISLNGASPTLSQTAIKTTSIQLTITNATVSVTDKEQKQLQYQAPLQ